MVDVKELNADFEKSQAEYERRSNELIPVRMKIGLEGFVANIDTFEIAPELAIKRAQLHERVAFYSRTSNPNDVQIKAKEHEFFAEYDFKILRGSIHGLAPGDGINLISIFFATINAGLLNINKGHFYLINDHVYKSAGFYTSLDEYRLFNSVTYALEDLMLLRAAWPLFKDQYENNFTFALITRRYFYSRIRLNFEDRIIDLMIALEALLVPETTGRKGRKIAIRLAKLVSPDFEYSDVLNVAAYSYRIRNNIIHGGDIRSLSPAAFEIDTISNYCQVAIRKYLFNYRGLNPEQLVGALGSNKP